MLRVLLSVAAVAVAASAVVAAPCLDTVALTALRAQVAGACDCASATSHGAHVRCVRTQAKLAAQTAGAPASCRAAVIRCAAKSTCGNPTRVACCIEKKGRTTCRVLHDAAACSAKHGTAGACASCCDACAGGACTGGATTTTVPGPTTHTVHVGQGGFRFVPRTLTIAAGDTVHWVWSSGGHDVVSGTVSGGVGHADGTFCSPKDQACASTSTSGAGATYDHTFASPGTFPYFCAPHAGLGMTGTITVQ